MKVKSRMFIILFMIMIYAVVCYVDFVLSIRAPEFENNPIAVFWIIQVGFPINILAQFLVAVIPLTFVKTWAKIDEKVLMFAFFYVYILVMIVGHVAGIVSWVC